MRFSLTTCCLLTCAVALATPPSPGTPGEGRGEGGTGQTSSHPSESTSLADQKQALSALQSFVGSWRGVGQPKRGSSQGAWTEQLDWSWRFDGGRATLVFSAPQGKFFTSGELSPATKQGNYRLTATLPDGTPQVYSGQLTDDGRLVLLAERPAADRPAQVTLRQVAGGDRMLILYERALAAEGQFARMAEVGFTRKGSGFGQGTNYTECVVTGGLGTISVEHQGRTWYVCCTGCRDLFNDDPAAVLADYQARKSKEKQKGAK
jgi:hypothetical protein